MNLKEQGNLLKYLYEKKYYEESITRQTIKQSESLKKQLNNYSPNRPNRPWSHVNEDKRNSSPEISQKNNKIYDFQYCNIPLTSDPASYRQFAKAKTKRKPSSVSCNRDLSHFSPSGKHDHWIEELKSSILHSKQKYYLNLLNQRKSQRKMQKTIDFEVNRINKINYASEHKVQLSLARNTITEVRKRPNRKMIRNRSSSKTHQLKWDDNDVLPWNVEAEEFA